MSKLSYKLQRAIDEMDCIHKDKNIVLRYYLGFVDFFKDLWYDYPYVLICNLKHIIRNTKLLLPHIIHMRDFDHSYQLNLFCDGLEYLAKGLKRHDHCVGSERNYRRCLFASRRLRNAYGDKGHLDKAYISLCKNNPIKLVKLGNGMAQMVHDYGPRGEEYYTKMLRVINKRHKLILEEERREAWLYLNKHFDSFWD